MLSAGCQRGIRGCASRPRRLALSAGRWLARAAITQRIHGSRLAPSQLLERDEIVRFFRTTCYEFIERAPATEMVYSASTGFQGIVGLQVGKFVALVLARQIGLLGVFQSFYLSGAVSFTIMAFQYVGLPASCWPLSYSLVYSLVAICALCCLPC
jgi:hypothetical protein